MILPVKVVVPAPITARLVVVAPVKTPFVAKRFVLVAFVVVEVVAVNELIAATPESVGLVLKTRKPVPVSSVRSPASSEEVSIEVDESLPLNRIQSEAERRPSAVFALAVGILSVCTPPADAKPQPPAAEVVAKVCEDWLWPFSEVIAPERRPRDEVATHVAVLPFVWRIMPFVPSDPAESRSELILSTPVVVALVAKTLSNVEVPVNVGDTERTTEPHVPVSPEMIPANSEQVSMSDAARKPKVEVEIHCVVEPFD